MGKYLGIHSRQGDSIVTSAFPLTSSESIPPFKEQPVKIALEFLKEVWQLL